MIELNKTHPDFDLVLEVLCSIPPHPTTVNKAMLAKDLGMPLYKLSDVLYRLGRRADTHGILSISSTTNLRIKRPLRHLADRVCENYWKKVYE